MSERREQRNRFSAKIKTIEIEFRPGRVYVFA